VVGAPLNGGCVGATPAVLELGGTCATSTIWSGSVDALPAVYHGSGGMMAKLCVLVLAALACLGGGCASLVHGNVEEIIIEADAPAVVLVDGQEFEIPATIKVVRNLPHTIEFPDGTQVKLEHTLWGNHAVWGNLLLLPMPIVALLAVAIDAGTGAAKDLEPDHLYWHAGRVWNVEEEELPPGSPLAKRLAAKRAAERASGDDEF